MLMYAVRPAISDTAVGIDASVIAANLVCTAVLSAFRLEVNTKFSTKFLT